jgi:uncharacterized protein (UPF0332 family)
VIWVDLIALARELLRQESEASRRSAISRAYYGAFNLARRHLEADGTPINNRGAHKKVWQAFGLADQAAPEAREAWQTVGKLGMALSSLRNQADYVDEFPGLESQAASAVVTAERILELLPRLELAD